jgi:hypothetical protein
VAVERLGDGLLEIGACDWRLRQSLEQDLALVEETAGAITALEGEVGEAMKAFCKMVSSPSLAWPSTVRIDLLSKLAGRPDAGRARVARPVGIVE